ncbi:MAG: hypothetical protein K9K62_04545 [Desulfobacteraceae bacterium]|nr:hypothetical protein [Desulfobacteraceae bacterium]
MKLDTEKTRQILDLSKDLQALCLLPVGYAARAPARRPRLTRDDIVLKTI